MTPKFKVDKNDRLFLSSEYICNGHWLFKRDALLNPATPKPLSELTRIKEGAYPSGLKYEPTQTFPDFAAVIPARDEYKPMHRAPKGVVFRGESTEIDTYVYSCSDFDIGIDPIYSPLLEMGIPFAKSATAPILILSETSPDSEFVGVIMPRRLK